MIIGESFNFSNYEEDTYDYLFKRRTPEQKQQKKQERKEKKEVREKKKEVRKENRQIKKSGFAQQPSSPAAKRKLVKGNFGLFNRNKKKAAGPTPIISGPDPGRTSSGESNTSLSREMPNEAAGTPGQENSSGGASKGVEKTATTNQNAGGSQNQAAGQGEGSGQNAGKAPGGNTSEDQPHEKTTTEEGQGESGKNTNGKDPEAKEGGMMQYAGIAGIVIVVGIIAYVAIKGGKNVDAVTMKNAA